jgi:hypothetical protein
MKKILILAAAAMLAPLAVSPAIAGDAPASSPRATYSTNDTDLGTLLDNPAAKAVLMKYIPTMISNPQIDMARSMTLKQLQSYAADQLPDAMLVKIDGDLANIPSAAPTPPGK